MKPHTKIYLNYFGYGEQDFIPCEIKAQDCELRAVDIHHIDPRGMGGSKTKDYIENLIGGCRKCHNKCESGEISKEKQREIHLKFMVNGKG